MSTKKTINISELQKILILCLQGLGNTLLFTPTLRLLHLGIPEAKITVVVSSESARQLLVGNQNLDQIYVFSPKKPWHLSQIFRFIHHLRSEDFDLCITAFPANHIGFNLISWLSGAKIRIGHSYLKKSLRSCSFLQNFRLPLSLTAHDVEQNLALLKPLGIEISDTFEKKLDVVIEPEHKIFAQHWLKMHNLNSGSLIIGFHPGSSQKRYMVHKRWPAEHFARLSSYLYRKHKAKIIIFGGPEEENLKTNIASLTYQYFHSGCNSTKSQSHSPDLTENFVLLASNMDLKQTAALISCCRFFISNDTGLMHVATAMGVCTLGIFGPTDPVRTRPWKNGHIVARQNLTCRPCWPLKDVGFRQRCIHSERICLSQLSPEEVLEEVEKIIKRQP